MLLMHSVHLGKKEEERKKEEASKATQQVLESRRRLLRLKHKSDADVSSVRVAGDESETAHRKNEEQMREVRGLARDGLWQACSSQQHGSAALVWTCTSSRTLRHYL